MSIEGYWYPAGSARRLPSTLQINGEDFSLLVEDELTVNGHLQSLEISPRIGSIPRKLVFKDHSVFETENNNAIDDWIRAQSKSDQSTWIHQLESRWHWIGVALIVVVFTVYSSIQWGLPWISVVAANHMPESIIEQVSDGSLEFLDKVIFKPSALSEDRRTNINQRFQSILAGNRDQQYTLLFRKVGIANALALPTGDLIVTDAFVNLATEEEFDAVLLHEIGHVEMRHGLQQLVRSSIVSFAIAMFVGDPSGVGELIVALPTFLLQSHYSRQHESDADEFAFKSMIELGIDPIHFANIMEKLEQSGLAQPNSNTPTTNPKSDQGHEADQPGSMLGYLSSHPATATRIKIAKAYSLRFRDNKRPLQ